jgi:hypothetical protein
MKKPTKGILLFIVLFIFVFFLNPLLISILTNTSYIAILLTSLFLSPITILGNVFATLFSFLGVLLLLSYIELNKAKHAYKNTRNRKDFIKDGEIVCFEGTINPKEGWTPLTSPISQKPCVLYCYGNKQVGGGSAQIPTVIQPSGDAIPLNGLLSGEYVVHKEFDPTKTDLSHLFSFMMEKSDNSLTEQDIQTAPYFYDISPNTDRRDTFSSHKVLGTISEESFKKDIFVEIYIPVDTYGWVLGKWDDKNEELLPLKFANSIFVIEKDYKRHFLTYIKKYRRNYLIGAISLFVLSFIVTAAPILLSIMHS